MSINFNNAGFLEICLFVNIFISIIMICISKNNANTAKGNILAYSSLLIYYVVKQLFFAR